LSPRGENPSATADDVLHLLLVPVAGVCDDYRGRVGDTGRLELGFDGGDHRVEVPEVR